MANGTSMLEHDDASAPPTKKTKHEDPDSGAQTKEPKNESDEKPSADVAKVEAILSKYGNLPLSDIGLKHASEATPETILAFVFHAMLTSARISHDLAYKSVKCLIEAGYHDVHTLKNSSWQSRTEVLTKGGYTRYREKTATALGELADFVIEQYDGDLNNIIKHAESSPSKVRDMIKGIKGIGNVGSDIFFDTAQAVWPALAPFIDPRSLKTAEQCGIGSNLGRLWEEVGQDATQMCRLSSALTTIRLEKKEQEFQ